MLPGLFIDKIIRSLKRNVNLVALVLVCVGLLCVGVFHGKAMLAFGALCTGLGYGIHAACHLRQGGDHRPRRVPLRWPFRSSCR